MKDFVKVVAMASIVSAIFVTVFVVRTYATIYRPKPSDNITYDMYKTLFEACSTLTFVLLPILSGLLLVTGVSLLVAGRREKH
jgi:hypothetical protein